MKNNKFAAIILGIIVLFVAFFTVRSFTNSNRMSAEEKTGTVATAVNALYYDNSYTFLKSGIQQEEITALANEVDTLQDSDDKAVINERLNSVQEKFDLQDRVNSLFDCPTDDSVIDGATIHEFVVIDEDLTIDEISLLRDQYGVALDNEDDGFYTTAAMLIDEAAYQVDLFEKYENDLTAFEADTSLTYKTLEDKLTAFVDEVNNIENPYIQSKLLLRIAQADEVTTQAIFERLVNAAEAANQSSDVLSKIRKEGQAAIAASSERSTDLREKSEEILASQAASSTLTLRVHKDKPTYGVDTKVASGALASRGNASTRRSSSSRTSSSSRSGSMSNASSVIASASSTSQESDDLASSESSISSSEATDTSNDQDSSSSISSVSESTPSLPSSSSIASSVSSSTSSDDSSAPVETSSSEVTSSSSSESSRDDSSIDEPQVPSEPVTSESSSSDASIIEESSASSSTQPQSTVESTSSSKPSSSVASGSSSDEESIPYASPQ